MQLLKHVEYTWRKLTKVKDAVIKVVPRTDATTRRSTGRWVDTMHDDGARKARWTTRRFEQTSERKRGFLLSNSSNDAPRNVVGRGSSERTRCGNRRLQRGFHQSPLKPDGTESQVWIELHSEAEMGPDYIWEAVSAFPGLKGASGAPGAWDTYSANVEACPVTSFSVS